MDVYYTASSISFRPNIEVVRDLSSWSFSLLPSRRCFIFEDEVCARLQPRRFSDLQLKILIHRCWCSACHSHSLVVPERVFRARGFSLLSTRWGPIRDRLMKSHCVDENARGIFSPGLVLYLFRAGCLVRLAWISSRGIRSYMPEFSVCPATEYYSGQLTG